MPKIILEFNLPEEQDEYELAHNAAKFYDCLYNFSQELRTWYKHGHDFKDADDAVEKIREKFYEELNDNNVTLN
jgi:hypothetical protein